MVSYTTGSTEGIWCTWTSSDATTSTASDTSGTWNGWCSSGTSTTSCTTTTWSGWVNVTYAKQESEAEKEARLEQTRIAAEAQKKRDEERAAKDKIKEEKARQLLAEVLTDEQDAQLDKDGYFDLQNVKTGTRYRINKGRSRNIQQLDDKTGKPIKTICFHPGEYLHNYDTMVIQKLMLENDEEQVRRVANYS